MIANALRYSQPKAIPATAQDGRLDLLLSVDGLSRGARKLAEHWHEAAGGRILPAKSDIRPECMGRILSNIVLYEYENPDMVRFRLAGSAFRVIHGRELTGTNFLDMMRGGNRAVASRRLHACLDFCCGIMAVNTTRFENGRTGEFRSFGLPLADQNGFLRYTIHVSEYLGGPTLPSHGEIKSMGASQAAYFDLGAGVPPFDPPF